MSNNLQQELIIEDKILVASYKGRQKRAQHSKGQSFFHWRFFFASFYFALTSGTYVIHVDVDVVLFDRLPNHSSIFGRSLFIS